jgi:threonine/homoserine/homoserine lactone efflux protein
MILPLATIGGISFILALSGVLIPGPIFTMTIGESMRRGFVTGPFIVLGHGLLELALIMAIVNGLGPFLKKDPVIGTLSIIGGVILLWMGWGMIKQARKIHLLFEERTGKGSRTLHPVLGGILASLSNPYWTLWWATIGLGYMITAMEYGFMGLVAFFIGHILADFLWFSLVSYGATTGRKVISDKLYQGIIGCCGFFLILFGAWFLTVGVRYFYRL